jgi:hypothetical protein
MEFWSWGVWLENWMELPEFNSRAMPNTPLIHKNKVMIIINKHGRLESLPRQDLPHGANSSLEIFNFSHAYFFASIGGFL